MLRPQTLPPIEFNKDVLKPREYQVINDTLGYSPDLAAMLMLTTHVLATVLQKAIPDTGEAESIFGAIMTTLTGARANDHNTYIVKALIGDVALCRLTDGTVYMLITLNVQGIPPYAVEVRGCPDLWAGTSEVIRREGREMIVILPTELPCNHDGALRISACKEGHIHLGMFHVGQDADKKYDAFDKTMSLESESEEAHG